MHLPPVVRRTASVLTASLCFGLQAQTQLPETVVTATRTATSRSRIGKSVEVITRQQIERSGQQSLVGVLGTVPGITTAATGRYGASAVFIRGAESFHTKILIDGQPIADVTGTQANPTSLAYLDLNNVERIEIVKGPQAVLHGSDAVGGVINVITREGTEAFAGSVRAEVGEHRYKRLGGSLTGTVDRLSWSVAGNIVGEDGISALDLPGQRDDDDYRQHAFDGRLRFALTEELALRLGANYLDADYQYDNAFGSQFQKGTNQQGLYSGELAWTESTAGEPIWSGSAGVSYLNTDRELSGPGFFDNGAFLGEVLRFHGQHTQALHDLLTLTAGFNHEEHDADGRGFAVVADTALSEFFLQNQMRLHDQITVTGGIRWLDHDAYGDHLSWQLDAAIIDAAERTRFHASIGTAYRAPSLYELFDGFAGNPTLQPEESLGFDLGMDHQLTDQVAFGLTYFHNEVDDLIIYDFGTASYANVRTSVQEGWESHLDWQATPELGLRATYVHLNAQDRDRNFDLARRPEHAATLTANWQPLTKLNLNGELIYAGERFSDPDNTRELAAYAVVNLAATVTVTDNLNCFARVANAFDEDYQLVADYNTYGRTLYAGLELRF